MDDRRCRRKALTTFSELMLEYEDGWSVMMMVVVVIIIIIIIIMIIIIIIGVEGRTEIKEWVPYAKGG